MSTQVLTGNDIISINDNLMSDLADGAVATLTFDGELTTTTPGKNGNSIITMNESGKLAILVLRVLIGSANDIYLNSMKTLMEADLPSFPLMYGQFVKRIGDGTGKVKKITYSMNGGVFTKSVDGSEDKSGAPDQAVAIYTIRFTNAPRVVG